MHIRFLRVEAILIIIYLGKEKTRRAQLVKMSDFSDRAKAFGHTKTTLLFQRRPRPSRPLITFRHTNLDFLHEKQDTDLHISPIMH